MMAMLKAQNDSQMDLMKNQAEAVKVQNLISEKHMKTMQDMKNMPMPAAPVEKPSEGSASASASGSPNLGAPGGFGGAPAASFPATLSPSLDHRGNVVKTSIATPISSPRTRPNEDPGSGRAGEKDKKNRKGNH